MIFWMLLGKYYNIYVCEGGLFWNKRETNHSEKDNIVELSEMLTSFVSLGQLLNHCGLIFLF